MSVHLGDVRTKDDDFNNRLGVSSELSWTLSCLAVPSSVLLREVPPLPPVKFTMEVLCSPSCEFLEPTTASMGWKKLTFSSAPYPGQQTSSIEHWRRSSVCTAPLTKLQYLP